MKKAIKSKIVSEAKYDLEARLAIKNKELAKEKTSVADLELPKEEKKKTADEVLASLDDDDIAEYQRELEISLAKDDYMSWLKHTVLGYRETPYHRYLASVCARIVQYIEDGKVIKVCLSVPPQTGKSYTVTESLPAWFVGRNPNRRAMIVCNGSTLAEKFGDRNRAKAIEHWKEVFNVKISESQNNKTMFNVQGKEGGVSSFGITSFITGHGASLIIVDDPYGEDVYSKTTRDNVERAIRNSVFTRTNGIGYAIVFICTRMHHDDLIGKLQNEGGWYVINIPALCDDETTDVLKRKKGQAICPELGKDEAWAENARKLVGEMVFSAQYQGKPSLEAGNMFTWECFHKYNKQNLPVKFDEMVQTWDLATDSDNQSDYVAGQVWGRKGADHYLLWRIKKRLNFAQTLDIIRNVSGQYPLATKKYIEKRASGASVIETLQREVGGIMPINPSESKVQRANGVLPYMLAGNIHIPDSSIDKNIDEDFITEFLQFPNGAHDDQVDATVQYLNEWRYVYSGHTMTDGYFKDIRGIFGRKRA